MEPQQPVAPRYQIIDGPSLMYLIYSLTVGTSSGYNRAEVQFTVVDNQSLKKHLIKGCIEGMSREDGSGESWLISVFVTIQDRHFRTEGYFNSRYRHGWLNDASN